MVEAVRIVQLTDTHLFADGEREMLGMATARSLQTVLKAVAALSPLPDRILLTGDLSQDETPQSYERLAELLEPLDVPTYSIPGNHDIPAMMQAILRVAPWSSDRFFQTGGWAVILLDSTAPGMVAGMLSAEQLHTLEWHLSQQADCPTLVALHHPPVAIASPWMDRIGLQNASDFLAIIDRHPQVKIVLFGHIHQEFEGERHGVRYLGTPSTCVQFQPRALEMALDHLSPGFRLLTLHPDGGFETTVHRVPLEGRSIQLDTVKQVH